MRNARFGDYWRKLNDRTVAHSAVTKLQVNETSFELSNFQVLSGQNGSGKSSLLKHLADPLSSREGLFAAVRFDAQISTLGGQDICRFQYTSPSWLVEENGRRVAALKVGGQFEEYIGGVEPFGFPADMLGFVNYIINTNFTSINIFELEPAEEYRGLVADNEEETDLVPTTVADTANVFSVSAFSQDFLEGRVLYVQTSNNARPAEFVNLSQGEQYIILLIYLLNTKRGQALLIDEPETYLSPLSQYRLADVFARFSVENKLQFIVASHSICFIEKARINGTLMVAGAHNGSLTLTGGKRVSTYLRRLGYKVPKENIALFEDAGAQRFFANIARNFDADWLASLELIFLNGESDIKEIIKRIKNYKLFAIFDGDQNGKTSPKDFPNHHVSFLPGTLAPEMELINCIKNDIPAFAGRAGIRSEDMQEYMTMVDGVDHHDYFETLGGFIGSDKWKLFDDAFFVWSTKNAASAETFLQALLA